MEICEKLLKLVKKTLAYFLVNTMYIRVEIYDRCAFRHTDRER